eukprot:376764-Pelagomonas_calceolata.AAC.7
MKPACLSRYVFCRPCCEPRSGNAASEPSSSYSSHARSWGKPANHFSPSGFVVLANHAQKGCAGHEKTITQQLLQAQSTGAAAVVGCKHICRGLAIPAASIYAGG